MDSKILKKELVCKSTLRGQVTKNAKSVSEKVSQKDLPAATSSLYTLKALHDALVACTNKCNELSDYVDDKTEAAEIEREAHYLELVCTAQVEVERLAASEKPSDPDPAPPRPQAPAVRLEQLVLPTFDGDPERFPEFWNIFKSRVHEDTGLSDTDKFSYLLSKLSGCAYQTVNGLNITTEGYTSARRLLLERFGKTIPLVNSHINQIMELPVSDSMNAKHLRQLADSIRVHVRSLGSLGVDLKANAQVLGPILLGKLPVNLRVKWQESIIANGLSESNIDSGAYEPIDIDKFLDFLSTHAEYRELGQQTKISKPSEPLRKSSHGGTTLTSQGKGSLACAICDSGSHVTRLCPKLIDIKDPVGRHGLIKGKKLCFNCLSKTHGISDCKSKHTCRHCNNKHHTVLCRKSSTLNPNSDEFDPSNSKVGDQAKSSNLVCTTQSGSGGFHPTFQAYLAGPQTKVKVRVLLDGCSNCSYISPTVANKLKLPSLGRTRMHVNVFNKGMVVQSMDICELQLSSLIGNASLKLKAFKADVCTPLESPAFEVGDFPHLRGLTFAESYSSSLPKNVDVLIGYDHMYDLLTGSYLRGPRGTPVALESSFGWLLHGPYVWKSSIDPGRVKHARVFHSQAITCHSQTLVEPSFTDFVEKLVDQDLRKVESDPSWQAPQLDGNRFSVGLPWKMAEKPLSNYRKVVPYQTSVYKKLSDSASTEYEQYFAEYEKLGIVEPCSTQYIERCWYLPHHGIHQKEKLRVVFDGSFGKPSLNQLLETGPNQLLTIPVCLTSFRLYAIPLVADIEKAFLQVGVNHNDRDFLRFLVSRNGSFFHYRFCRVPFGLCCSPALLNSALSELYSHSEAKFPHCVAVLRRSMYCDDLVTSVPNDDSLHSLKLSCSEIFRSASMNLRGWSTTPPMRVRCPI